MSNSSRLKRAAVLAVAATMAVSVLFTGCGSSEQKSTTSSESGSKVASSDGTNTATQKLEPIELSWYTIGTPQKDVDRVFEEASKYTNEKINASIKMTMIDWDKYEEKMKIMIQSGEKFDMCFTCSWALPYDQMAQKGAFLPLDDLLEKYGQGIKQELGSLFIEGNKINGKLYGISNNKEYTAETKWIFNKNLLDKYNLKVADKMTLQDLEPMLKVIKENEPNILDIYGADCGYYSQTESILGDGSPFVVPYDSNDLKIVDPYDIPKNNQDMRTLNKYYKEGYIRKDVSTYSGFDRTKSDDWFIRIDAVMPDSDASLAAEGRAPIKSVSMFDKTYVSNFHVAGSLIAISATSENPERSMMFLNLLNTDKYLRNLVNFGIENEHYALVNGKVKKTQTGTDNYDMSTFTLGNEFITYPLTTDPDNVWDIYQKFNDGMEKSAIFGFKADISNIKKEVSTFANINAEFQNMYLVSNGNFDEIHDKYMKKMKSAGYDKVFAELQKQLDAWKASK